MPFWWNYVIYGGRPLINVIISQFFDIIVIVLFRAERGLASRSSGIWTALNRSVDEKKYTAHHPPPTIHHQKIHVLRWCFPQNFETNQHFSRDLVSNFWGKHKRKTCIFCRVGGGWVSGWAVYFFSSTLQCDSSQYTQAAFSLRPRFAQNKFWF